MKRKIGLLTIMALIALTTSAQTIQSFFDKYADDERFQYVSVGKGMTNLAGVFGGHAKNEKQILAKMNGIKILSLEASSTSTLMKQVENELNKVIVAGKYETGVQVRDKGEKVNIYYQVNNKDRSEMLIVTKEKGELSIIWISGRMSKQEMIDTFSENKCQFKYPNYLPEFSCLSEMNIDLPDLSEIGASLAELAEEIENAI